MSQEAVERVLGRLLTDEGFRRSAKESLEVACMQQGYLLTTTELSLLSTMKLQALTDVAAQLHPGLCRAVKSQKE
jgi:hypothetical protein